MSDAATIRRGPRRLLRSLLWCAVTVQALLLVARFLLEVRLSALGAPPTEGGLLLTAAGILSVAAYPAVGVLLLRKRPANPVGWLFCVAMIGWAVNNAAQPYVYLATIDPDAAPFWQAAAWMFTWPGFLSTTLTVLLLLLFPDGSLPSDRWRPFVWLTVSTMTLAGVGAAFAPGPLDPSLGIEVDNPLGIGGAAGSALRLVGELGYPVAFVLVVAAVVSLVFRYGRARGVERLQIKWFVSGVAVWAVALMVFLTAALSYPTFQDLPAWGQAAQVAAVLGGAVIPIAAGIGIVRYRLYDIDRVVSRTVSYAALTVILVAVYAVGVVGLGSVVRLATGGGGGDLVVAASTLVVAAAFGPLRRRVQAGVDRRFNRARYDALRTVERFTQRLRDEVDIAVLTAEVRDVALRTLQPVHASVWVPGGGQSP